MRILYVCNWVRFGGLETNLVLLTRELTARGHTVLIASDGGELEGALTECGGRHIRVPIGRGSEREVPRSAQRLARIVEEERVDVIHVFSATTAGLMLLASLAARARRRRWPPVVSSVMGLQNSADEPAWRTYLTCWGTTLGVKRTLVISPAIGDFMRRLPIRRSRVRECPVVGVDVKRLASEATPERIAVARRSLDLPSDARVVSTIGMLAPRKSHELFLRAAARVHARVPNARFVIVGEGPTRGALESERNRLGLDGIVLIPGQRADVAELIGASEVYVKPGVVEGFVGITVLEAQAVGRPVVAFDTVDVRLAIDDGTTGVIVPNGDTNALADAIVALLEDRERTARLCAEGKRSVREKFSIEAVVDRLEKEYAELGAR